MTIACRSNERSSLDSRTVSLPGAKVNGQHTPSASAHPFCAPSWTAHPLLSIPTTPYSRTKISTTRSSSYELVKLVRGSDWVVLVGREEEMPETRIDMGMKDSVSD
jgi:hypothetical protein